MIGGLDLAKASLEPHELAAFLTGKLKEGFITNQALLDESLERMYLIAAVISGLFGFVYSALLDTRSPVLMFIAISLSFAVIMNLYGPQAAPFIATALFAAYHSGYAIACYILGCAIVSMIALSAFHNVKSPISALNLKPGSSRARCVKPMNRKAVTRLTLSDLSGYSFKTPRSPDRPACVMKCTGRPTRYGSDELRNSDAAVLIPAASQTIRTLGSDQREFALGGAIMRPSEPRNVF